MTASSREKQNWGSLGHINGEHLYVLYGFPIRYSYSTSTFGQDFGQDLALSRIIVLPAGDVLNGLIIRSIFDLPTSISL